MLSATSADQATIFVLNPGSTSTKLAIYEGENELCREAVLHDADVLRRFSRVWDQFDWRLEIVGKWFHRAGRNPAVVTAIGGLLKPIPKGAYRVNDRMLHDARSNVQGEHSSNLGCALAYELAREYGCEAFVVDPVSVDEFESLAKYSGHPMIQRRSLSHALNIHAAVRQAAGQLGISVSGSSFVVAHLGGGISIAAVRDGLIIDVNDASSDGPFSPERTGGLPLQPFISMCFSGTTSEQEIRRLVMGSGGLQAYLGTNSAKEVESRIEAGDSAAREVYEAMAYQIAKEIGAMATVLHGNVHAIVLTGGLAASQMLTHWISERIRFIAPILIFPGEDEMRALAMGTLRVLRFQEEVKEY